jgi:cytochrome c553
LRLTVLFFLLLSLLKADDSYERGKTLYMQKGCYSCHGTKAEGMHNYPRLANRAKGYLTYKLTKFKNRESDNQQQEMMIPFAVGLSDAEIDFMTTYFTDYVEETNAESYDDSYEEHGDGGS